MSVEMGLIPDYVSSVSGAGRVVIPKVVRDSLGIVDGDKVAWFVEDEVVFFVKKGNGAE